MAEKLIKGKAFQDFIDAINPRTDAGKLVIKFLTREQGPFMQFVQTQRSARLGEQAFKRFERDILALGFPSVEEYSRQNPEVAKVLFANMRPGPGQKTATKYRYHHPATQFDAAKMAEFVAAVRKEFETSGTTLATSANTVLIRDYNLPHIRYMAFRKRIAEQYLPDLLALSEGRGAAAAAGNEEGVPKFGS